MKPKPVVLVLLQSYLPGYKAGGPVRSVANLVEALGDELEFRIVTSDRDLGEDTPYPEIAANCWLPVGKARVMYISSGLRSLLALIAILRSTPSDLLYLNSFFSKRYSILPALLGRLGLFRAGRVIMAPRGEFSSGALKGKSWRKKLYISVSRALGVYRGLIWHASSQYEELDIRRAFRDTEAISVAKPIAATAWQETRIGLRIVTAPDMPQPGLLKRSKSTASRRKPAGSIRLVFLSRVCRMKNLSGAISLLNGLSGNVRFTIYGPTEDAAYWRTCKSLIARLPPNIRVEYAGQVSHDRIESLLTQNDVFFLPTLGENYGHVIMEALLSGCPVIISDQTPWRKLERHGVGWDLPLAAPDRFRRALQTCIDMSPETFAEFSRRAKSFGIEKSSDAGILEQNRSLFGISSSDLCKEAAATQ